MPEECVAVEDASPDKENASEDKHQIATRCTHPKFTANTQNSHIFREITFLNPCSFVNFWDVHGTNPVQSKDGLLT